MKPHRKAQGLSINVIIIAALGLIVLVVLSFILFRESGVFGKTALSCEGRGGTCVGEGDCESRLVPVKCPDKDAAPQQCCFTGGG